MRCSVAKDFTDTEIENILKSYKRLKLKVTAEEEQLYGMYPSCVSQADGMPKPQGVTSNQTSSFGIKNASMREYLASSVACTAKQVRIIELIYDALDSDCRDLVKICYFERHGRSNTLTMLNITKDVFGDRRRRSFNEIDEMLASIKQKPIDFAV